MKIPFALPDVGEAEAVAVANVIENGWLTTGATTQEFEAKFAHAVLATHALAVSSATMGFLVLFEALGLGAGDEVVFSANTFSGPAMMARKLGIKVRAADSSLGQTMPSYEEIMAVVTENTKAVVITDFGGEPFALDQVLRPMLNNRGIKLIYDAAHAFPAFDCYGNPVGSDNRGDATVFSFYATKCLTTGEGGMITTADHALAKRIKELRLHGFNRSMYDRNTNIKTGWEYDIAHEGWKANLTDTASAMGLVQLRRATDMHKKRESISDRYDAAFSEYTSVVSRYESTSVSAYHLYTLQVHNRDQFIADMGEAGVQCSVHFKPLPLHSSWKNYGLDDCPNAAMVFSRTVSLPIFSGMTDDQVSYVIEQVINRFRGF